MPKLSPPVMIVASVLAVVGIGLGVMQLRPHNFHATVIQSPDPAPAFELDGSHGKTISPADFEGEVVVLYFGYTFCPDICPTTLIRLSQAMEILGRHADDVQVVMVSVDPERDSAERLHEYMTHFDERFLGATGTLQQINAVATVYGVYYQAHDEPDSAAGYLVDHTSSLVVLNREGQLKLLVPPDASAEQIAEDLRHVLR